MVLSLVATLVDYSVSEKVAWKVEMMEDISMGELWEIHLERQ